jgi:Serine aminopeptidase, S33
MPSGGDGEVMGLSTEHGAVDGYEAVELLPAPAEPGSGSAAMLRRRSARSSRRAVLYVHCLTDSFVPESLASWYAERGFHFYVADLRSSARPDQPADEQGAGPDLRGCTGALDVMARHLRESEAIDTVVVSAHATGALIAALWCDARRKASPAEALILADPAFGTGRRRHLGQDTGLAKGSGSGKGADPDEAGPARGRRLQGPLASAQRQLRRGLDISCPVLVMCTAADWDARGDGRRGLLLGRQRGGGHGTTRLGRHVTWLRLDDGLAGPLPPPAAEGRPFFGALGRWLGAYLAGQFRDQLL